MKYLVTGAHGQLGREWVQFLSERKADFSAFGSAELDITNPEQIKEMLQKKSPDVVINCAAYTNVDQAENESERAFLVNETGVKNLAEGCESIGAKLVHYSTDYVFPGIKEDMDRYPDGYPEEAGTGPVNVYGQSKLAGEVQLQKSGADFLLIRVSWLCGAYGSNFVKTMIRLGHERDALNVVNDQIGSPSFALDVVEKTFRLLEMNQTGIFHVSSRGPLSWADFAKEIFKQTGLPAVVNEVSSSEFKTTAPRPAFSLLSNKKITELGLAQSDWKKGLGKLLHQINAKQPG